MILIGQYDSPFVRRVGIALTLYRLPFEHRPWSTFSDAEKIRPYNPLTRVPTLVLDDGDVLIESHSILDYLDSLVPASERLFPAAEPVRHQALKVAALATGISEKAVSLFYERVLHKEASDVWTKRCGVQINGALAELETNRTKRAGDYWFGDRIGHAGYRHCVRAALHRRRASGLDLDGGVSAAWRRRGAARSAAGLPGDRAAIHPAGVNSDRARRDVHGEGEQRGIEQKRNDTLRQHGATDRLRRDGHVGYLRAHADREGEIHEVPVIRFLVLRERHAADNAVAPAAVIFVRVVQREYRMDEGPGQNDRSGREDEVSRLTGRLPLSRQARAKIATRLAMAAATVSTRIATCPSSCAAARRRMRCTSERAMR